MKMEGMSETVNLFDCLVKANAIIFHYTTPDGRDEMVKFPLAGFCENYLMQFAKERQKPYGSNGTDARIRGKEYYSTKNGVIYTIYLKRLRAGRKNVVFL